MSSFDFDPITALSLLLFIPWLRLWPRRSHLLSLHHYFLFHHLLTHFEIGQPSRQPSRVPSNQPTGIIVYCWHQPSLTCLLLFVCPLSIPYSHVVSRFRYYLSYSSFRDWACNPDDLIVVFLSSFLSLHRFLLSHRRSFSFKQANHPVVLAVNPVLNHHMSPPINLQV